MDFAPYQDDSPSEVRAKSPSPRSSRAASPRPQSPSHQSHRNINSILGGSGGGGNGSSGGNDGGQRYQQLPDPSAFGNDDVEAGGNQGSGNSGRTYVDLFETSLPLRLDYEAMAAYLLLPPVGGVALLILEHKSDYVRFHAWQSALIFSAMFVIHLIFSAVAFISWLLFIVDLGLIAILTLRAYKDADTLDRFEIPPFGRFASSFVDDE